MKTSIDFNGQTITIGQTVYLEPCGNFARRRTQDVYPAVIKSFGRRYIHTEISPFRTAKIDMATSRSVEDGDCNAFYRLWLSEKDFQDACLRERQLTDVIQALQIRPGRDRLPNDAVQAIYDILKDHQVIQDSKK